MTPATGFSLRPAAAGDFPAIQALVRAVQINPIGLAWERFVVAVDAQDRLIGCGQVKRHHDGSLELASIAVQPEWRRQGVARAIIERLIADHPGTLFLTCRMELGPFYQPFGFQAIEKEEMSPYFRRLARLIGLARATRLLPGSVLVMRRVPAQHKPA